MIFTVANPSYARPGLISLAALLELPRAIAFGADADSVLLGADFPGTLQLYRARDGALEQLTSEPEPVEGLLLAGGEVVVAKDTAGDERHQLYLVSGGGLGALVVDEGFAHWTPHGSAD